MKSKSIFVVAVMLCSFQFANAQKEFTGYEAEQIIDGASQVYIDQQTGAPGFVRFNEDERIRFTDFPLWFKKIYQAGDDFSIQLMRTETDRLGFTHYRYQEYYNGYPVNAGILIAHVKDGMVHSVNGKIFSNITANSMVMMNEHDALLAATNYVGASAYKWQMMAEEKRLKEMKDDQLATYFPTGVLKFVPPSNKYEGANFQLAWEFKVYAHEPMSHQKIYVDVTNGNIIATENLIHTNDVTGTAVTGFSGTQTITVDMQSPSSYRLQEVDRYTGNGMQTYNLLQGTDYGAAVDFTDADNYWDNVNGAEDQYATDAHFGTEATYDYFWLEQGRNSHDGNGITLYSYVHYSVGYDNAFWDGTAMTYGDGSSYFDKPLTTTDICGHEVTHAVTQNTAGLIYSDESGGLNESFSDIFGSVIEWWATPAVGDWLMGEDCTLGAGIRDMSNPNAFSNPDTYGGTYWYNPNEVHNNSGVQNFWFYLLSDGGTGTNDIGSVYSVNGIGVMDAADISYRSLSVYLTPSSPYSDARYYAIQAAIDLFGPCTPEVESVTNAWYACGVGAVYNPAVIADFTPSPAESCVAPAEIFFNNNSSNAGTFVWDFGDGATSNAINPIHTYTGFGTYTVTLSADGGTCGSDVYVCTNCVTVDANIPCVVWLPQSGTGPTQYSCTGTMYDSGGPNADYGDNVTSTVTIAPTGASSVTLNISQFDYESNYDYLTFYNGPSTGSPLIGSYTGGTLPNGGTIVASSGSVTIQHYSDFYITGAGFGLTWTCALPNQPPTVDFVADATTSCTGLINFTDLSTQGPTIWLWDFGDGGTSSLQHPSHQYVSDGIYTVMLTATNIIGTASHTKPNYITVDKPDAPVVSEGITSCVPTIATLTATGSGGTIYWYDDAAAITPVGSGSPFVTPIISSTTSYYAEEAILAPSDFVGLPDNSNNGGALSGATDRWMLFDVYQPCKLVSVWTEAGAAGNRTIEYQSSTGAMIQDTTIYVAAGQSRVYVNFDLVPGSQYRLACTSNNPDMWRCDGGTVTWPYTLPGYVSITGTNSQSNNRWYFFFDWEIKGPDCVSELAEVEITIGGGSADPTIQTSGPTTFCENEPLTLTAAFGYYYDWSTGETTQSITVNQTGNYAVSVSSGFGCDTSNSVSVVALSAPSIYLGVDVTACKDTTLVLDAGAGFDTYDWSNGSTLQTLTISVAGTYSVTVTNSDGCSESDDLVLTIYNSPPSPTITQSGNQLTADAGYPSYDWYLDGVYLTTTTVNTLDITQSGSYEVFVTDQNGCSSFSNAFNGSYTGIENVNEISLLIYPNPTDGKLFIEFGFNSSIQLELINILGETMMAKNIPANTRELELNLSAFASGVYFLVIHSNENEVTKKIVLQK